MIETTPTAFLLMVINGLIIVLGSVFSVVLYLLKRAIEALTSVIVRIVDRLDEGDKRMNNIEKEQARAQEHCEMQHYNRRSTDVDNSKKSE